MRTITSYTIYRLLVMDYHYLDKHLSYCDNHTSTIAIIAQPYYKLSLASPLEMYSNFVLPIRLCSAKIGLKMANAMYYFNTV